MPLRTQSAYLALLPQHIDSYFSLTGDFFEHFAKASNCRYRLPFFCFLHFLNKQLFQLGKRQVGRRQQRQVPALLVLGSGGARLRCATSRDASLGCFVAQSNARSFVFTGFDLGWVWGACPTEGPVNIQDCRLCAFLPSFQSKSRAHQLASGVFGACDPNVLTQSLMFFP